MNELSANLKSKV